jgi:uncharacterized protein YndB with AHSA1/START domain
VPSVSGTYEQIDGAPVVRFERTFPHGREQVWDAITDPAQLARWFPTTVEFERLAPGAPIEFHFAQDAYPPMSGRFNAVEPRRRLQFTWGDDLLTFELHEAEHGAATRLSFTVALDDAGKAARDGAGWEASLDKLNLVAGGARPDRPGGGGPDWQSYYDQYKSRGFPATAHVSE